MAFFGGTGTGDAARNAGYWLQEIDGYGENDGYITLVGLRRPLDTNAVLINIFTLELPALPSLGRNEPVLCLAQL